MPAASLKIESGFASETGRRNRNEDYCAVSAPKTAADMRRGFVAAVADGIGGAPGGREAAEIAVNTFMQKYRGARAGLSTAEAARDAVSQANAAIIRAAREKEHFRGMGTTLSVLVLHDNDVHTAHVGDSRIYRLRAGKLAALTEDHNLGSLGMPNILTRSLGSREEAAPDCAADSLAAGDRFLLCTDGITGVLDDDAIAGMLAKERDPEQAARTIVAAALAAGGSDNATALIVDVAGGPAP